MVINGITLTETRELLGKYGLSPLKKLGQNFLTDSNITANIASVPDIDNANVIEIGPGLGALTREAASRAANVVAIEIDAGMVRVLNDIFRNADNVHIVHADVLKTDFSELAGIYFGGGSYHVMGNLPYYITAKCIIKICESNALSMTAMVQREVADRLASPPGSKNYSSLTASVSYYAKPELKFTVSKNCFYPAPDVESAIIYADLRKPRLLCDRDNYTETVRHSFAQRRKTIFNNLCCAYSDRIPKDTIRNILAAAGISENQRAETISPETFALLSEALAAEPGSSK